MFVRKAIILGALALVGLAPSTARADVLLTPFIGANFGGDTQDEKLNYGGSIGFMGAGVFGVELDFGYSPNFFEVDNDPLDLIGDSNVTTLMGNLIVGVPLGGTKGPGVRPYGTVGMGLMRTRLESPGELFDVDKNSFGVSVGGGVMGFFNDSFGLRGDVRYFRNISDTNDIHVGDLDLDLGSFNYWRGTAGVVFRF